MNRAPEGQDPGTGLDALSVTAASSELQNLPGWPDVVGFLQQLAALSAALVPQASCGVTMRRDNQVATVASSDEFAILLGEIQYGRGQGPGMQALRTGERVEVPDLATDDRWGEYRVHALTAGVRSSVSLPLTVGDATIGAVNLYSRARDSFGSKVIRWAESLTLQAASALALLLRQAQQAGAVAALPGDEVEELRLELDEARDTFRTIRSGGFDALVIDSGADRPSGPSRLLVAGEDGPEDAADARGVAGNEGQDDQAHRWYRLLSLESFTAGCPCGWVSPERDTSDEMARDVDRHLDEVRQAGIARP